LISCAIVFEGARQLSDLVGTADFERGIEPSRGEAPRRRNQVLERRRNLAFEDQGQNTDLEQEGAGPEQ
jgi:hypothetical protein